MINHFMRGVEWKDELSNLTLTNEKYSQEIQDYILY